MMTNTYIATFFTHYGAIAFQRYCTANGYHGKLMPVPRFLSSSCGTCVRFDAERWDIGFENDAMDGVFLVNGESAVRMEDASADNHTS